MRFKTKTAWIIAGAVFAAGLIIWPGCATPPLPSSRKPIEARKKADFKFLKSAHPTRAEMADRLGEPHDYFPDLRVASYEVNKVTQRKIFLCLFVIPVFVDKSSGWIEYAFVEFDEQERVQRVGFVTAHPRALRAQAKNWVAPKAGEKPGR